MIDIGNVILESECVNILGPSLPGAATKNVGADLRAATCQD